MPLVMQGNWTVAIKEKKAAFAQRFIISGASTGNGTYAVPHAAVNVTGSVWSVRIQSRPTSGSAWSDSEYQITFPVVASGQYQFDLQSNDVWPGDKDFNDLVLTFSTPVTETDFLVYGHVSTYSGCLYNPCYPRFMLIESELALARARLFPAIRDALDKLYPTRLPRVRIPLPDPPPELPAALLAGEVFRPMLIPVQGETATPVKKARVLKTVAVTRKAGAKAAEGDAEVNAVAVGTVDLAKPASVLTTLDQAALGRLLDHGIRRCQVDALVNAALRFQEYDRTAAELAGGVYTGEGTREDLGQASTDRNGNYVFRFRRTLTQIIGESNADVAPGEDEVLQAMPDLVVQVLGSRLPGGTQYETAPRWNIPVLKRLNICIPSSYWPYPTTGCHGRPISHIGFIPVGKPATVTLDADGLVTCTDTSKIDIPQTNCAAWWGALRLSACIGKYDQTPHYTIEHRARRPDGIWTTWRPYQEALMLDNWNSTLGEWVATKVGPYVHNLELVKGSAKEDVPAYNNVQGNMDWSGTDWFIKAIIPSWVYSYLGGPGSVEFRLKAYGPDDKQLALWTDPVTALPRFSDTIRLFIDHTGPELAFKDITIGTPVPNPCPLFSLTPAQLVSATLDLKFKAVQRQGLLNSYALSVTKCNAPSFPVADVPAANPMDMPAARPLQVTYVAGSPCTGLFGTMFGETPAATVDDYVAVQLNPDGVTPWLDPGETLSSFTLNLSASVRRTDGHSNYPGYGPVQYNLVIQRAP